MVLFARHPLEVLRDKLDENSLVEAVRLAVTAELDAISFYLQVASRSPREDVRKVFEDVAREEKTHVGEFMELLRRLDPRQAQELEKGAREVVELVGGGGGGEASRSSSQPNASSGRGSDPVEEVVRAFTEGVNAARRLWKLLPVTQVAAAGYHTDAAKLGVADAEVSISSTEPVQLREVSVTFSVPSRLWGSRGAGQGLLEALVKRAASVFAASEEKLVVESLVSVKDATRLKLGDWSEPGRAVEDVASAVAALESEGLRGPYVLVIHPRAYSALLAFHERSGVMELARVERLARVVVTPFVGEKRGLLLAADRSVLDIAVGVELRVDYLGQDRGGHVFHAWETAAVRVFDPRSIVVMEPT
jgi:hypothetical protein